MTIRKLITILIPGSDFDTLIRSLRPLDESLLTVSPLIDTYLELDALDVKGKSVEGQYFFASLT